MSDAFDDARLDDPRVLESYDAVLRHLAESGARVRREAQESAEVVDELADETMARAVVAAGEDARLLRAVLEPWCPIPFVAWPGPGLPGWAGAHDLVVVLGPTGGDAQSAATVRDAKHRGCSLVVACPAVSALADLARGRHVTILETCTGDSLAAAVVMLRALHRLGVGPDCDPEEVARVLDDVAVECSPYRDIAVNPAKDLALSFADVLPLVWGGSVLAARAARRVAETMRRTTGRPALAADLRHLTPVIEASQPHDVFADPFADDTAARRPGVLVLDDGTEESVIRSDQRTLLDTAAAHEVRARTLHVDTGTEVARYAALLTTGGYAAQYLGVGLDRQPPVVEPE